MLFNDYAIKIVACVSILTFGFDDISFMLSTFQAVPSHDLEVQNAAHHVVKTLQQRSNSLFPYELHEIVDAKAEVVDDSAKFDMLLILKRADKEEKYKVEVHKNLEGTFRLNNMQHDHS
ncbi:hypothetical protein ACFE04_020709 [Oxalis oulophora]